MKTLMKAAMLGTALSVTALCGGTAFADDAPAPAVSFTGNIAITTDYMFRGISQTNSEVAVQGGFDASAGAFYAGTWASSISFAPMELDLYAGFKPVTGPISWDIGAIGYLYPSAKDDAASFSYWEGYVKPSIAVGPATVGISAYVSPDFFGETGTAYYIEGNGSIPLTKSLSISGAVGYQDISDVDGPTVPGDLDGNYITWNAGATYSLAGFALDLRYVDTDIGLTDTIAGFAGAKQNTKGRVVFSIKRAM